METTVSTKTMSAARSDGAAHASLGIAMMLFGIFLFMANDTLGKWLVSTYSIGQVLFMRSAAALFVVIVLLRAGGYRRLITVERPGLQALRAIFATLEVVAFYGAVAYLPLADTMAFWLAVPIYVAALSPLVLGEKVGARRWTAILIGFVGVIVVLRPSSATLTGPALIAVAGSLAFALMMLTARSLRGTPDLVLVFWQMIGALLAGFVLMPFGWVTPPALDIGLLAILGITAMFAHMCVTRAFKRGDAAQIAPLQYTMLLWAALFGYLVFGDVPQPTMLIGAAIIVGSGLFIFFRERQLAKKSAVASEPLPPG